MIHQRFLAALDSSSPLLFIEAIYGSGVKTALRQWEARGGSRHDEIRLLFDAGRLPSDPVTLARVVWSAMRLRLGQELPELPDDVTLLEEAALRGVRGLRRPVAVAVHSMGEDDAEKLSVLLHLIDAGARLIIAGNDVTALEHVAQRRGSYYAMVPEREVWFTLAETRTLVRKQGVDLAEEALAALHHATLGHPGMVRTSLAAMPLEVVRGAVTRDRAIAVFLAEVPLARWPSGYADFLVTMVHLPRFTPAEAISLTNCDDASRYLDRLQGLAVGRMVWHPGLQQRVFRWNERIRQVIKKIMPPNGADSRELLERVVAAARIGRDEELEIVALLHAGELEQAEALLREKIWDLLPNAMAPLWSPLEQISPLALADHPALLSARLRLSPHRSRSPISARAARQARRRLTATAEAQSPWSRVGNLAYAIEFALYAGEREHLIDLFIRVRALIADLVDSEASDAVRGREISELLLIADTVFRSGNAIPAAEIGRFAVQLLELDPSSLDPRGERADFARRLILHDHRARGLEEPFDAQSLLAGTQFLWRDGDIVVTALTLMWSDFDDGDFGAADAHLGAASQRIADPEQWPVMMLMRTHLAMYRQSPREMEAFASAYERSTLSEPGPFAQGSLSELGRITDYLSRAVGRPVPSPGFLPATPEPGRLFYPRTEFVVHLMEALYAVRAGRPSAVRAALAQAVALSTRRELGVYTLANATAEEVEQLRDAAEQLPGGSHLHLEKALLFAGNLHRPLIDLSEREREVLQHLREGATNPEMAQAMFVSVNTVKFHRANLMRKLGVARRDELLAEADRLGL